MARVIKLVQRDTKPALVVNLVDVNNGDEPINVVGASVLLHFREMDTYEPVSTVPGVVVNGEQGIVVFHWEDDTLEHAGDFEGEIEITYADGGTQTVFDFIYFVIREQIK